MANIAAQTYKNHTRFDPAFHYFLAPLFLANVVAAAVFAWRHPGFWSFWVFIMAIGSFVLVGIVRHYSLKVQDRIIRLEERLRLGSLAEGLSAKHLAALRFAADAEAAALAERAVREGMTPDQIKRAVAVWREDRHRV